MSVLHLIAAGVGRLRRPAFDARAAVELARLNAPFFPASRFALAPSALLTLVNDIVQNRRQVVLELGSGASTLHIAKALTLTGGMAITVDSDRAWLDKVMATAREAGLAERLSPVFAPLQDGADGEAWYDPKPIFAAIGDRKVDLLLVDGPPAHDRTRAYARRPAAAHLKDRLAPNVSIYLDDIHRPSHAKIAREWGRLLGMEFTFVHARGGFAYAARGQTYDPIL